MADLMNDPNDPLSVFIPANTPNYGTPYQPMVNPPVADAARQDPTVSQNYYNQLHAGERDPFATQQVNLNSALQGGAQTGQSYGAPPAGVTAPGGNYTGAAIGAPYKYPADPTRALQDALGGLFGGIKDILNYGAGTSYRGGATSAPPQPPYNPLPTNPPPGRGVQQPSTYYNPLAAANLPPVTPTPPQTGVLPTEPVTPPQPGVSPTAPTGEPPTTARLEGVTYNNGMVQFADKSLTEQQVSDSLTQAAQGAGITAQQLIDFINKNKTPGTTLDSQYMRADNLVKFANAAKTSAGNKPAASGAKTQEQIYEQSTSNRTEAGAAANRYFQELVLSQPQAADSWGTYAAAVNGGFTGNFTSWLVTKDQILHQARGSRSSFGGGGGGGVSGGGGSTTPAPVTLPNPTVTEPNVRPFGQGATVQFDQSDLQAIPDSYRPMVDSLMRKLGYVSTGFMGQFGETEYQTPQNPVPLTDAVLSQVSSDPAAQAWLKWLLYRKGVFGGVSPWPVTPPAAGA